MAANYELLDTAVQRKPGKRKNTHCLCAFDLGRVVWVVGVDGKGELEGSALVHAWATRGRKEKR
jgi:hypothetical protein